MSGLHLVTVEIKELRRIYKKAGEPVPTISNWNEEKEEWVDLTELRQRTGKTAEQVRYIRQQHPEVLRVKEGRDATKRNCYLYNITEILTNKY